MKARPDLRASGVVWREKEKMQRERERERESHGQEACDEGSGGY
jgi:hypothetical protein